MALLPSFITNSKQSAYTNPVIIIIKTNCHMKTSKSITKRLQQIQSNGEIRDRFQAGSAKEQLSPATLSSVSKRHLPGPPASTSHKVT